MSVAIKSLIPSAAIAGIIGSICLIAFIVGGKNDDDGQGVNSGPKKDWE